MMHKSLKLALVGLLVASSASALSEMRSPWITERGPIRYTFEKLNKDKSDLNLWWAGHYKGANKAFLKHSTKTHELTALIFNQADFTMNQIFPDSKVPFGVEEYSPFIKLAKFSPRANYSEFGFTLGGRWDCPVYEHKGRIGLRASIPLRQIKMEREDFIDKNANPLANYVATELVKVNRNSPTFDIGSMDATVAINDGAGQAVSVAVHNGVAGNADVVAALAINTVKGAATAAGVAPLVAQVNSLVTAQAAAGYIQGGQCVVVGNNEEGANVTSALNTPAVYPLTSIFVGGDQTAAKASASATAGAAVLIKEPVPPATVGLPGDPTTAQIVAACIPTNVAGGTTSAQMDIQFGTDAAKAAINTVANRGNRASINNQPEIVCTAYRLDLVQSLEDTTKQSVLQLNAANQPMAFGQNVSYNQNQFNRGTVALTFGASPAAVIDQGYTAWQTAPVTHPGYWQVNPDDIEVAPTAPTVAMVQAAAAANEIVEFDSAANYSTLLDADGNFKTAAIANAAAQSWVTFRHAADATDPDKFAPEPTAGVSKASTIANAIANLLQAYRENPYSFLDRKGYNMDTRIRRGLGDIDLDLFYEHTFNPEWMGELWAGVRFPTGGSDDKYGSPYLPILGNGNHWELKLGAQLCYQPASWVNMKLDAYYSFVLEATEHRMAAFKGAAIKNMGPRADADVDWGYFVGRLDFNFFHPKTSDIRSTVGYEFYYKTEDHVSYKQGTMASWLGKAWDGSGYTLPNLKPLSNALEQSHTEGISHKVRFEVSYQVMKYLEVFSAASAVFAGQNVMADRDCNIGFNVRF